MIKQAFNNYKFNKLSKTLLQDLIKDVELIREKSQIIAFSPDNTGLSYLGIKQGTISLFPNSYVSIPHYYSNPLLNNEDLEKIGKVIGELKFNKVIFRGITQKHNKLIQAIKKESLTTEIIYLHSGPPSEFYSKEKQFFLCTLQDWVSKKLVDKVGVNKKGLQGVIGKLLGIPCYHYIMKSTSSKYDLNIIKKDDENLKIGIFGNQGFNKNVSTQILAALNLENSEVHILKNKDFSFYNQFNLIEHNSPIPHQEFVNLINEMHLNYYISFSETWGHIVLESLACGVPCLTSSSSGIFEFNDELKNYLVVNQYDDIEEISQQSKIVLNNYNIIQKLGLEYIEQINKEANNKLYTLLNQ